MNLPVVISTGKKLWLISLLLILTAIAWAQSVQVVHDKHLSLIKAAKDDTTRIRYWLKYADEMMDYDNDTALPILQKVIALSEQQKDRYGLAKSAMLMGVVYADKAAFGESRGWYDKAIVHFTALNNQLELGKVYNNIGNLYFFQDEFEDAISWYFKAVDAFERSGESRMLAQVYDGIGNTFHEVSQPDKSLYYLGKAEAIARTAKDTALLSRVLNNKSVTLTSMGKQREGVAIYREVLKMADKGTNLVTRFMVRSNLANSYINLKQPDSARYYIREAERLALQGNTPYYLMNVYLCYVKIYQETKHWHKAKEYLFKAKAIAENIGSKEGLWKVYGHLLRVYARLGMSEQSLAAFEQFRLYNDSVVSEKMASRVNELETKYRTLQKDKELSDKQLAIEQQNASLKKKDMWIVVTVIAMVTLLIIGGLIGLGVRQQQKLHWLMIRKEQELLAIRAMMEGEERERTRIARNLHDGVGSILSAARLNMDSLGLQVLQLPSIPAYRESLMLLKDATAEIRETAHNLLPVLLHEQGLQVAVKAFCEKFNSSRLQIEYQAFGEPARFNHYFELMVYRTIQELLNNIVRHAEASRAIVQLAFNEETVSVTVEDNGKGFDPAQMEGAGGLGIRTLHARMKAFQGKVDIDTSPQGTSVHIEFKAARLEHVA